MRSQIGSLYCLLALVFGCSGHPDTEHAWVVNADIVSADGGQSYLAGYDGAEHGFVKELTSGRLTTVHETTGPLSGIWAHGSDTAVAVGSLGDVAMLSDGAWHSSSMGAGLALRAVWGSEPTNVVAVGHAGVVHRYDGAEWHEEAVPTQGDLHAIWGTSSDNIFAVGKAGLILRYDGSTWSVMPSGTTEDLNDVWGRDPQNVYVVGGSESTGRHVVLRYDGATWITERAGTPFALLGVHGNSTGDVYAVGAARKGDDVRSAMLHFDGSEWHESTPPIGEFLWSALALDDGGCYVVGPNDTRVRLK